MHWPAYQPPTWCPPGICSWCDAYRPEDGDMDTRELACVECGKWLRWDKRRQAWVCDQCDSRDA